jgi:outer membrane receptor protein involved in Fe transport
MGAFAEGALKSGDVTLTAGGRVDRWWIEDGHLRETIIASGTVVTDSEFADRDGWRPTGRAGLAWQPAEAVTLRAAGYLGWRLPTVNELYRPFRVGADVTRANQNLEPERLKGIEGGADFRIGSNARVGLTLFANRLEDAIANVTIDAGPPRVAQRQNVDAVVAQGFEIDGAVKAGPVHLSASYSHVDAEMRASGIAAALNGRRPAQTPRDAFSATTAVDAPAGIRAALTARYVGAQFEDDLESQELNDALTFDAVVHVPVTGRLSVEARGENLTNKLVMAGISGAGIVERATPRTLWIGLRLR